MGSFQVFPPYEVEIKTNLDLYPLLLFTYTTFLKKSDERNMLLKKLT